MSATATAASRAFRLNIEEAFNCIGRDRNWPAKLGLLALFSLLSIVIVGYILVQGYLLTFIERVARAEPTPLPEWDDWGDLFHKGLIASLVNLIYFIPYLLLLLLIYAGQFSLTLLPSFSMGGSGAPPAPPDPFFFGSLAFLLLGYGALFLFQMAVTAFVPAVRAQLALHDADFASVFRFGEIFGFISRYRGQYAIAVVLYIALTYALSFFGQLACCIGVLVTNALCQLFLSHLIGQLCWHERTMMASGGSRDGNAQVSLA